MKHKLITKQPEVGQFIRELRLLCELTQEQFAAFVGVTYPTVNRWENGHSKPSPMAFKLIEHKLLELGTRGKELLTKYSVS
ncbi:Transcriptional Regulator, XRE family [Calothrix sp. PCC 7716]|nr:Transcriptional Regulator, XRE family [Calothrix sp. PCC 7716]